ncbi:MAG: hypothetical protein ACOY9Y_00515 [Bacillota bacterium]
MQPAQCPVTTLHGSLAPGRFIPDPRGEELVEEIAFRLKEYDQFIARRVQEFENDIADIEGVGDQSEGFHGLEVFLDKETRKTSQENREEI